MEEKKSEDIVVNDEKNGINDNHVGKDDHNNIEVDIANEEKNIKGDNYDNEKQVHKEISNTKSSVSVKIGLIGDASVGKTTLMVKQIENKFDELYIETLGVNMLEKTITIRNTDITFSLYDLGDRLEFHKLLPLVCVDAVAFFFIFDLSRKSSLYSIKEWYRQTRALNKNAHAILIGNKYDIFTTLPMEEQEEITTLAKKYAKAMGINNNNTN